MVAFAQTAEGATATAREVEPLVNVVPLRRAPATTNAGEAELPPLLKAVEPEAAPYVPGEATAKSESRIVPGEIDRDDLICLVRKLFNDGEVRDRDAAIGELARDLGYLPVQ